MRKTIAKILIGLALINGAGAIGEEEKYLQDMFKSPPAQTQSAPVTSPPSQNGGSHLGTTLEFAVSAGALGVAGLLSGKSTGRLVIERVVNPRPVGDISAVEIGNSVNLEEAGLGNLVSYVFDDLQLSGASLERINAVAKSGQLMISVRVAFEKDEESRINEAFEYIEHLLMHKIEQSVEEREAQQTFEAAFAECVAKELEEGKEAVVKTLRNLRMLSKRGDA